MTKNIDNLSIIYRYRLTNRPSPMYRSETHFQLKLRPKNGSGSSGRKTLGRTTFDRPKETCRSNFKPVSAKPYVGRTSVGEVSFGQVFFDRTSLPFCFNWIETNCYSFFERFISSLGFEKNCHFMHFWRCGRNLYFSLRL